ncbi:MAG: DUF1818 family protein [Oscillatoriales cyanobacterium RM2_1_1]|nr:DUF1818 family protein [Oscillatoriales cyanobacterium SM2_3_0]NJO45229.1 DUF1818 family protein [Oscillatoriales cyanobacterium RM2_1_1]
MTERMLKQGAGWRIGWNPQASKFKGLLGGENWAIELTEAELNDFCRLLDQLMTTLRQMQVELMEEEKITCEAESNLLWIQVEGCPPAYQLHLILNTERRSEGSWSANALPELIAATKLLKTF